MIRKFFGLYRVFALLVVMATLGNFGIAFAENASSTNYKVTDTQFGSGSVSDCSSSYCANATTGDLAVGKGSSSSYQAQFGAPQGSDSTTPLLEVIEVGGLNNLGILSSTSTATTSTTVKVRAYNISGYTIQISGTPPQEGTYTLKTPSTPTISQVGSEQFGINMVANTAPSAGADPVQVPDSSYSYGEPTSNYDTTNKFMYNQGDVIASSTSSTGETDYTISMILNISNTTPGGQYSGTYDAVVVPVY
jgi:hypothetical protein